MSGGDYVRGDNVRFPHCYPNQLRSQLKYVNCNAWVSRLTLRIPSVGNVPSARITYAPYKNNVAYVKIIRSPVAVKPGFHYPS